MIEMVAQEIQYDVRVTNAFKSYGSDHLLKGLTMQVPSCVIYGLLGPSGCGKSTLLQCILGVISLDNGCIDLKAQNLKDVGYMPQDLCLDELLTIKETFEYYGTLYNMSKQSIEVRINELKTFLHLPSFNDRVNELSGGQCRRVSLAISLLHDPKIIILDEPTVGIDPLLKQEIWAEFTKMVKEHKKTIIITTHYIEEANQANCVGLMRNGILVEEGPPEDICMKYNADSLEEAFLKLCCNQTNNEIVNIDDQIQSKRKLTNKTQSNSLIESENQIKFYRIAALIKKNVRLCSRDLTLIVFALLLPIIQTLNFCSAVGVAIKDAPIAIKNDEVNYSDCHYSSINGCIFDEESNLTLSCIVMQFLESHDYKLVEVNDRVTGESKMNNPTYMAFLYFPKNFTTSLLEYIDDRENYDLESRIYARLNMENFVFRNQIRGDVFNSINYLLENILNRCSEDLRKANPAPLNFSILYGYEVKTIVKGIINMFIAVGAFHFAASLAGSLIMSEKWSGHLKRSLFAGVKLSELLISIFLLVTVLLLVESFMACFISFVMFSNPILISYGLFVYLLAVLLTGCIGFLCGILIVVLSATQIGSLYALTGMLMTQMLLAGIVWPLEGQPYLLKIISNLLPITVAGNMMNNVGLKGWTLEHPLVRIGAMTLFGYIIFLVLVLFLLGKFKKNMWNVSV